MRGRNISVGRNFILIFSESVQNWRGLGGCLQSHLHFRDVFYLWTFLCFIFLLEKPGLSVQQYFNGVFFYLLTHHHHSWYKILPPYIIYLYFISDISHQNDLQDQCRGPSLSIHSGWLAGCLAESARLQLSISIWKKVCKVNLDIFIKYW